MKHSKIVVFLSLLLVAVMAFSSCSGSAVIPEGDEQLNAPKEDIIIDLLDESTPADAESALKNAIAANKTEIANAVAKWHDYVGFKQNSLVADETAIGKDLMNNYTRVTFERYGALIVANARQEVWDSTVGESGAYVTSCKRVLVYNLYKENFEEPVFDSGDYKDWEQTPEANYTSYSISTNSNISGFRVLKTERIAKYEPSQENPEVQVFKEYETKYSTSFYTTEAIVPTVEENMAWSSSYVSGYYEVTIGNKIYAINHEGEILKVFDKGLEYVLPVNADYEKNGLRYYFENEYVYVLDENFAPLSSYAFLSDYDMKWEMLPNGNVFFQYKKQLDDNAEVYDYKTVGGDKYDVVQHIYNVKTGAVSELELGYIVDNLYDSDSTEFTVKNEDNFIVEAIKYTKGGVYSKDTEPAVLVLKGDFELVAELPEIIENQTGMPKIVALNKLVVTTEFAGAGKYNVLVSTEGSYELLPYGVSFGKTSFNYDGETCIYSTSDNHEFSTPFENYSVVRTFNGTTTLIKTENSGYAYLYYYSASRGEYVKERFYRADDYERIVTTVDSLILFEIDEGEYTWYDAAGNSVVNTESTNYYRVGDGILIHVYHAASDYPNRYYFVK